MAKTKTIKILGNPVRYESGDIGDMVCISDIAKINGKRPEVIIQNWLRNKSTVEFLCYWEELHNNDFNHIESEVVRNEAGSNAFTLSAGEWITNTNARGITTQAGRYGGTYAHFDITLHFCNWYDARFYVHVIRDFRQLKEKEISSKSLAWHLEKITYNIDEVRNLLDTIPGQRPDLNRLNKPKK
jgi:hypothetical protein